MNETPTKNIPELLTLVLALVLLLALGYSILPVISPFVITGAMIFLLYPVRHSPFARRLLSLSLMLFLLWFFYSTFALLAPFLIALVLAYMVNPFVTRLEQRRVPRWASSLLTVFLLVGIVVAIILFVVPPAVQQFDSILTGISLITSEFVSLLQSGEVFNLFARFGIPVEEAKRLISQEFSPRLSDLLRALFQGVFGFVSRFSSLALQIINAIIIPFLLFYLLKDLPHVVAGLLTLVPANRRSRTMEILHKVDVIVGKYLRGAIIVAIIQGTISATALWLIGVRYPLVLGIMTGVLNIIPYVGLITSLIVSSLVALFSEGFVLGKVIAVILLYLSQKLLEATVLAPKIIGTKVGLHPVVLILCLVIFGFFLGFVGMLIAVPATALILAAVTEWLAARDAPDSPGVGGAA